MQVLTDENTPYIVKTPGKRVPGVIDRYAVIDEAAMPYSASDAYCRPGNAAMVMPTPPSHSIADISARYRLRAILPFLTFIVVRAMPPFLSAAA